MNANARPAAEFLTNRYALNANATFLYTYADADTSRAVGLHSATQVRDIVTRVMAMHPGLSFERTADSVLFRSADRTTLWCFTLA